MRHPKHRTTIYVVVRYYYDTYEEIETVTLLDSFRSLERAEEVKGNYEQEARDRGLWSALHFEVMASTYYDL